MFLIKSGKAQLGQIMRTLESQIFSLKVKTSVITLCSSKIPFAYMGFSIFMKSVYSSFK